MRNMDNNRAANYIKKHERHKKWIAFALCLSLLTGTVTLYVLNKPATAMTSEGAKSVGLVLETADNEFEAGLIQQMEAKEQEASEQTETDLTDEAGDSSVADSENEDVVTENNNPSENNNNIEGDNGENKENEDAASDEPSKESSDGASLESSDAASDSSSEEADEASSADSASSESSVEEEVNEQEEFVYEQDEVKVTARLSDPSIFPAGVELKVTVLDNETEGYNYDAYMEALNNNAESIADEAGLDCASSYDRSNTMLFDIAFMRDDVEVQPLEGSVDINVEFTNNQLSNDLEASSEQPMTLVHLPLKDEAKESADVATTQDATDITASDIEVKTLTDANIEVGNTDVIEFTEDGFSVFAVTVYQDHTPGTDDYLSVLGDAVNFGIVTNEIHVNESETNFATRKLVADGQSGNDMTNPSEQTFMVADVSGSFTIKGEKAYFILPDSAISKVSHQSGKEFIIYDTAFTAGEIDKAVSAMLAYTRAASKDLASRNDNAVLEVDKNDGARYMVDLTKPGFDPNGTYYVTLTDEDLRSKISQDEKLRIYKHSGQTIVFNVPKSGDVSLHKFMVSSDGGQLVGSDTLAGRKQDPITRSIIWNLENASNVVTGGGVVGVFISGRENATWHNINTSAGWIAFPNVDIVAEFHNTYDDVQQISGTARLEAYKNVDGKPSTVSGFKFKLAVMNDSGNWVYVQEVTNSDSAPQNITFDSITYGNNPNYKGDGLYQYVNLKQGESKTFLYVIDETAGTTDSEGNAYKEDERYFFAKVTVTAMKLNPYTETIYYKVSPPEYYSDFACRQKVSGDRPVFENKTKCGNVGLKFYKFLNNEDPGQYKFSFTVRKLTQDNRLEVVERNLVNDGKNVSYEFSYSARDYVWDDKNKPHVYMVITENDITGTINGVQVKKDDGYILVRIDNPDAQKPDIVYYKANPNETAQGIGDYVRKLEDPSSNKRQTLIWLFKRNGRLYIAPEDYSKKLGFFNTGKAMLRIHKMVVNDFGSDFVRDNVNSMLNSVQFRITNNQTGNYIILKGFAGKDGETAMHFRGENAYEYDALTHQKTGREYNVIFNSNAQWTIEGIDIGTYTVEEVADGFTFSYDPSSNTSTVIMETPYSRVTMYAVTTDAEEVGLSKYGTGGENFRKVFSADVSEIADLSEKGPGNVRVGDISVANNSHTETVQVANYYSKPIGPIQVTKNLIGGTLSESTEFVFTIAPIGFVIRDSAGKDIKLPDGDYQQPMPVNSNGDVVREARVTLDKDHSTGLAVFESIPFRFEGTYDYTITENATGVSGIKYDTRTYYVRMTVGKNYTQFEKSYTYVKGMTHPEKYTKNTTINNEDFYYLGANVQYATDEKFRNVVAECDLYLGYNPVTGKPDVNEFQVSYRNREGAASVAFNNERTGELTVIKRWMDKDGNLDPDSYDLIDLYELVPEKHTSLTLSIMRRPVGTKEWSLYKDITLTSENLQKDKTWKYTETNIPLIDENGRMLEYCVKEPDVYMSIYSIVYTYNGKSYEARDNGNNPKYVMNLKDGTNSFGVVTITNTPEVANELPSTGGTGTVPYAVFGALLMAAAALGMLFFGRKKKL